MISILAPSRGRPEKSFDTLVKWCNEMQRKDTEVIISVDSDDSKRFIYTTIYGTPFFDATNIRAMVMVHNNRSAVDAINNAAIVSSGDILMVVSDDTECIPGWDVEILKAVGDRKDWILKTQDGIQPWIITMPVMDRAFYNRFGYIYHPDYRHCFCDTELTCVADITGRKIKSNLLFPHKHYSVTKEQPDAINKKADSTWAQGEKLFLERYKRNFDLPKGGKIEGQNMIDWLIRKGQKA